MDKSAVEVDITEFRVAEASVEAAAKRENLVTSRGGKYSAFTVAGTRLFVAERGTGKILELRGLPLEWRPFSDLAWAGGEMLMFDRWSQPHYGVHYAVNVRSGRLVAVAPFADKVYRERRRPERRNKRRG